MPQFAVGEFRPIAEGCWVAQVDPEGANIGLVAGSESAVLIDAGSSPAHGLAIREAAEAVAGVPLVAVVLTHWHWDHSFGLTAFTDLATYGHETVRGRLTSPDIVALTEPLGLLPEDLAVPSHSFSLARVLDLGGRRVEFVHFGRGHTEGDVVAIVPELDVIFAGDLLEESSPPSFGEDCFLKEWPSALDGILGLVTEHTQVVPGHGAVMDRIASFDQRARISGLYGQVEHLIGRGVRQEQAWEAGEWPFDEAVVTAVLPLAYRQLAAEGLVPRTTLPLA